MNNVIGLALSLAVSLGLISGVSVLHDTAFGVALAMNVLAWILFIPSLALSNERLKEIFAGKLWKLPFTFLLWFALGYSNHPYLLASSVLWYVMFLAIVSSFKGKDCAK